ncbi:hypothetical protein BMF94_3098 [Rhodotorula taiwanensis]|uniref:Uncharacterized protein n=1 Tax=Rhodotorula taiwanensis TaxID=741276 RepID=A0A2S5BAP3_9BASI|nr:hypothetical protein BMF94_3098 [Rhodotorula taiwanensis]
MGATARTTSPEPLSATLKHVSFHPLALRITTAPEGEPEQAMVVNAAQEMAQRKRRVGVRTYRLPVPSLASPQADVDSKRSWDTPQIGDATSKAWHSMLNGFSATLEPFLNSSSPAAAGGVCSQTRMYGRDTSPDRSLSRSRSRSVGSSPGRGRSGSTSGDPRTDPSAPEFDPAFTPNSPPRLRLKLPTIKRTTSRIVTDSGTSPVSAGGCVLCPRSILRSTSSPRTASASSAHCFPDLARVASPPPPPYHEPTLPACSDVVPVLPCCSDCENATLYGSKATLDDSYEEHWSRGARRMRQEAEKREAARAEWKKTADEMGERYRCPIDLMRRGSALGVHDEDDDALTCPGNRLGELVKERGHVDELAPKRGRHIEEGDTSEEANAPLHEAAEAVEPAAESVAASASADPPLPSPKPPALESTPATPAPDAPAAAAAEKLASTLNTRESAPPARPPARRRFSSSLSRIAASLGTGLLSPPSNTNTFRAVV